MEAPSAASATASGSPDSVLDDPLRKTRLAVERFGERGDEPGRLTGDGRQLQFIEHRRRRRGRGTGRAAKLHALGREENLDALIGAREQEEKRIVRPDRPPFQKRFGKPEVAALFRPASRPSEESEHRRHFELGESIVRERDQDVGVVVEREEVRKRGAQRIALRDRDRLARPARDRLLELQLGVGDGVLENEVRDLWTQGLQLHEQAKRRPRARRELARDVEARRRVGCLELRRHHLGEGLDGLRIVRLGRDEMVARHAKPYPSIPGAFA